MRERRCDVAIIGAGTAGLHAWKSATAQGADAVLIERGEGGSTCTRTGCMPSKLLIAAARAAHEARTADRFGIRVSDVAVDGPAVLARLRRERDRFVRGVLDEYAKVPDANRLHGAARFAAPDRLLIGDEVALTAGAVVIATGGRPIVPEGLRSAEPLVRTHETIFDIEQLPRRLAVVGASILGLELAQAFARLGAAVTVLGKEPVLGKLADPEAERAARDALGRELAMHLGVEVTAEPAGEGAATVRWSGDSSGEVEVDLILAATGRPPDVKALELDKAGIELDDQGTPLFDHGTHRCGRSNIYVAGDAGAWRPVLHEAARGGRIAGAVAAGGPPSRVLPALSVAFTEPNLVQVGTPFDELPEGARVADYRVAQDPRSRIDGFDAGIVRLYADRDERLLGGTIVAAGGEHLGAALAMAVDRGLTATDFADQPWYHPVVEEMLQHVARDLCEEDNEPNE